MTIFLKRQHIDIFYKYLFRIIALFSILALGAILLSVFGQGLKPFFTPTAQNIRIVIQRIDELTVNGTIYQNHTTFIDIEKNTSSIIISFPSNDGENILDVTIHPSEKDPQRQLSITAIQQVPGNNEVNVNFTDKYVCTVRFPGTIAALEKKIHIILPEPPYNIGRFLTGLVWNPNPNFKIYGIFTMIAGTLLASFGAILIGVPIGLLCALFMSEFLPSKFASIIRSGVELLAGIPSVVYGFFGLMVIVPAVRTTFNVPAGNTLLSAMIVLSLMILPTVITIAETSLKAVPLSVREASLSLGASKMQTSWFVVLPHANSGVIAGIILGISRAVGETMAVILVAGNSPQLVKSPLESVRTLTATIAMEMGYASGRHSEMLFSIGVTLFIIILILNSLILWSRRQVETV
jgi:phosphate transport system permease protein